MQIIVDKLPEEPRECLFSQEVIHGVMKFYACTLKPDIPGKHKNSLCICRDTSNCLFLREV